jgi:glutamyl-tRNA reductase
METLGVVGVSFRRGGSAALARFTIPKEEREDRLPELAASLEVDEMVYLATCNRVEIAFRGNNGTSIEGYRRRIFRTMIGRRPEPGEAERTLLAWAGEGAVEHILLVAAGLDSAQLGEKEIRAQMSEAIKLARAVSTTGPVLDQIFGEALRLATEIHRMVDADGGKTSLAEVATDRLLRRWRRTPGKVALVGISPMTKRAAHRLRDEGFEVLIVNRTAEKAEELAERIGVEWCSLADFQRQPEAVEAVLLATGSQDFVLGRPELERLAAHSPSGEPPLIVDMAVPPDVDPEAARTVGIERLGMDDISAEAELSRNRRLIELAPARELVDRGLARLRKQLAERSMGPIIARLNKRYRQTAEAGLERLFKDRFEELTEDDREVITRWAMVMSRRFTHIPTMGLRAIAAELGESAVRTFLDASGEDFFSDPRD